jgi:hypothetical protein
MLRGVRAWHPANSTTHNEVFRVKSQFILAAPLALAVYLVGCGGDDGRLDTYPVAGEVYINGQPAAGCTVVFVPLNPELKGVIMPGGKTDEKGRFQLTTYETNDGAPAGEYGVTLRWEATKKWPGREAAMRIDPVAPVGPDRLMGQYASPEKSKLTATVTEGENELAPFRLNNVRLLKGAE